MTKLFLVTAVSLSLIICGCATTEKSILLGSGVGLGLGAGIGNSVGNRNGGAVGAIIGALVGGLIGYSSHEEKRKKDLAEEARKTQSQYDVFSSANGGGNRPKLKPAQVKVRYVEDLIKDGIFTPAHFDYEISEPAHWEGSK